VFFLDIEGHMSRPEVSRVLKGLRRHCTSLRVLGSYPVDRARLVRGA
jgi:prephenate dehydratase